MEGSVIKWQWNAAAKRWDGFNAQGRLVAVVVVPGHSDITDVPDDVPMQPPPDAQLRQYTAAVSGDAQALDAVNSTMARATAHAQQQSQQTVTQQRQAPYGSVDEIVSLSRGPETVEAWNRLAKFSSDLRLGRMELDARERKIQDRAAAMGMALPSLPWAGAGRGAGAPSSGGGGLAAPAHGSAGEDGETLPDLQSFMSDPATVAARLATGQIAANIKLQNRGLQLDEFERQLGLREQGAERLGQYRDTVRSVEDLDAEYAAAQNRATLSENPEQALGQLNAEYGRKRSQAQRARGDLEWAWYPESAAERRRQELTAMTPTATPNDAVPEYVAQSWGLPARQVPGFQGGGEYAGFGSEGGFSGQGMAAGFGAGREMQPQYGVTRMQGSGEEQEAVRQALEDLQMQQQQSDEQYRQQALGMEQARRGIIAEHEQAMTLLRQQAAGLNIRAGEALASNPSVGAYLVGAAGVR